MSELKLHRRRSRRRVTGLTHSPEKLLIRIWTVLTALKRNPGQSTVPGLCRLLPQLVTSCDPGGGVGECRPGRPNRPVLIKWLSMRPIVAAVLLFLIVPVHADETITFTCTKKTLHECLLDLPCASFKREANGDIVVLSETKIRLADALKPSDFDQRAFKAGEVRQGGLAFARSIVPRSA